MTDRKHPDPGRAPRNRRRFTRVALDAEVSVTVLDTGALSRSRLRDLSENGVFIVTNDPRPIGTRVRVSIFVKKGGLVIEARGVVVHEVCAELATAARPAGMGVMFTDVAERSLALLRQLARVGEPV